MSDARWALIFLLFVKIEYASACEDSSERKTLTLPRSVRGTAVLIATLRGKGKPGKRLTTAGERKRPPVGGHHDFFFFLSRGWKVQPGKAGWSWGGQMGKTFCTARESPIPCGESQRTSLSPLLEDVMAARMSLIQQDTEEKDRGAADTLGTKMH